MFLGEPSHSVDVSFSLDFCRLPKEPGHFPGSPPKKTRPKHRVAQQNRAAPSFRPSASPFSAARSATSRGTSWRRPRPRTGACLGLPGFGWGHYNKTMTPKQTTHKPSLLWGHSFDSVSVLSFFFFSLSLFDPFFFSFSKVSTWNLLFPFGPLNGGDFDHDRIIRPVWAGLETQRCPFLGECLTRNRWHWLIF